LRKLFVERLRENKERFFKTLKFGTVTYRRDKMN